MSALGGLRSRGASEGTGRELGNSPRGSEDGGIYMFAHTIYLLSHWFIGRWALDLV